MSSLTDKPTLRDRVRARPMLFGGIAVAAIAVIVVVLVVFQPQRLLYDNVVDEEFPVVESSTDADEPMSDEPADEPMSDEPAGSMSDDADAAAEPDRSEDATASDEATSTSDGSDDDEADEPVEPEPEEEAEPEPTGPMALATGEFISRSRYTVTGEATIYELEDGSRTLRLEDFESTNGPNLFVYLTSADAEDPDADLDADYVDLGALRGNVGNQNYDVPADVHLDVYDTVVIWCRPFSVAFGAADLS